MHSSSSSSALLTLYFWKIVHTKNQLTDNQNSLENIDPVTNTENNDQNPTALNPTKVHHLSNTGVGHTPSTGTHTYSSPFNENYDAEISPVSPLKELIRVKLENQVLMELYKEQETANGLKALITIILKKSNPKKSYASHTKKEVNESTARINKREKKN